MTPAPDAPPRDETAERWGDAVRAARLVAVDPAGIGGIVLRAHAGPVRERWLALLQGALAEGTPLRRLPVRAGDDRLLGGLDLAETLRLGRPVLERGLLADCDGGIVVAAMAERMTAGTAARLAAALDTSSVHLERDGLAARLTTRIGVVALDEGIAEDERPPPALAERLGCHLDLTPVGVTASEDLSAALEGTEETAAARSRLGRVAVDGEILAALVAAAAALGIGSLRAPSLALKAARAAAALDGRDQVAPEDAELAARLVLAPRATCLPALPEDTAPEEDQAEEPDEAPEDDADTPAGEDDSEPDRLEDRVLAAAAAAIPADLLALLNLSQGGRRPPRASGPAGAPQKSLSRGRPLGTRQGRPGGGVRLNVVETLRAAAPWQPVRRARQGDDAAADTGRRVLVRPDDFRINAFKQRSESTAIFLVDASGSAALHRLAEAKGAVETLLADCYIRREQVALIAFRGQTADLLLPPTRSLVRAKRSLSGLPGGGGTPLAAGIDAGVALAEALSRKGRTPILVLLTDGRANIARDGSPGREQAGADALAAARAVHLAGLPALLIDMAPRPQPAAQALAMAMAARYLALPHADPGTVSQAVRVTAAEAA